jgi:D-3-phosphoglycerate dehydrogenase
MKTMRILILDPIDSGAIERLREQHQVFCISPAEQDALQTLVIDLGVLIFRSGLNVTAQVMECAPDLKLLTRAGSGIDNVDPEYIERDGLNLVRIPEPGAKPLPR